MLSELLASAMRSADMSVGLARNGMELDGYSRASVPTWEMDGATASTTVTLGPFLRTVEFDEVLLFAHQGVERFRLAGAVRLLPGMVYDHTVKVSVRG